MFKRYLTRLNTGLLTLLVALMSGSILFASNISEEMKNKTLSDAKNLLKDYEYDESKNIVVDSTNTEDINKLKNHIPW